MTFTISIIFFCLGGFAAGQLGKKIRPGIILRIAAIMLFGGFFGVSRLNPKHSEQSLILLYVLYGILCGGGVGMGYNTIISTVNKWFADRAGIAVILVMGSFFMKVPEEKIKVRKDSGKKAGELKNTGTGERKSFTTTEMLKSPSFWLFMLWAVLLNSAGLLVINSAASIAAAFGALGVLGLVVSVCNGVGRVLMGALFDKIVRRTSMLLNVIFTFSAGTCLFLGATALGVGFIIVLALVAFVVRLALNRCCR